MENEQMKKDIELLERDLMRDLTEKEKEIVKIHGWKYFIFDHLQMNEKEYRTLRKITKIISAYCTQNEEIYEQALEGDTDLVYFTLKSIVNDLEKKDEKSKMDHEVIKSEVTKYPKDNSNEEKVKHLCKVLNMIPKKESNWVEYYVKNVSDHSQVLEILSDYEDLSDDEICGNVVDAIKDSVIDRCVEQLKEGKALELDPEMIAEVTHKVWNTENNVQIQITNNVLTVKFK